MDPSLQDENSELSSSLEVQSRGNGANGEPKPSAAPPSLPEDKGIRRIIRNFTPSWFAVTMGTGIVSILLHNLPYNGDWIYWISVVFFLLNIVLFVVFFLLSVALYAIYPEIWGVMVRHPTQSLFLGTFPMGLATIVNMIVYVCVPAWGTRAIRLAWALWWIDVVIAVTVCFWMPFVLCVAILLSVRHEKQFLVLTSFQDDTSRDQDSDHDSGVAATHRCNYSVRSVRRSCGECVT